ncbi:hypothetical protein [Sulfitobacter sp. JB4-11]|uniref:hypothetical protein n=1 Tax=Sulfitobacter rhodophyticola TaxID=3238304 RepID=UPI003516740D
MTHVASNPALMGMTRPAGGLRLWPTYLVALLCVALISLPNLIDPMMRYDDFPALMAEPAGFWEKTLHEGRWVNYLWHERGFVTPSWLNFAIYQMLWALFAASLAVAAVGRHGQPLFTGILALMVVLAPSALLISLWFNTLLPGLALVSLYAWLGTWMRAGTHRGLLPPFVVVTFMAYTTYPLLLLAVCLVRSENRSVRDLVGLLGLFIVSFAAAVLCVYTINLVVHGVFGVPLADWREATPAHDVAGVVANLSLVQQSITGFLISTSFGFTSVAFIHMGLLCLATVVLLRRAPTEAAYLHAGLWIGMALVVVQILKMGAPAPPRGFAFAWVFYALMIVRAAQLLKAQGGIGGRLVQNAVLLMIGGYIVFTFQQYASYRPWQQETRALAAVVAKGDIPVTIIGDVLQLPSAQKALINNPLGLEFRMDQLTGQRITLCDTPTCDAAQSGAVFHVTDKGLLKR